MTMGYKLVEGWQKTQTQEGASGTKVYLTGVTLPDVVLEDIPVLGESWDDDPANYALTCKNITQTLVGDCVTGLRHTCNYNSEVNSGVAVSLETCLKSMSVGAETQSWEPKNSSWTWDSDATAVAQPIFKLTTQNTISIERFVSDYSSFVNTVITKAGTINDATFLGVKEGALLFIGADMQEFIGAGGAKSWKTILHFVGRNITGDALYEDSWLKVLRTDNGAWDKPKNATTGDQLYLKSSFDILVTT